ncbi:unnamed protein product [Mesocestoides corti]|uniref:HMG box domain-containing protein n=2 Tax=Mesocestoides corti TaxID=53468 RepID=A0A158QUN1_MESCO|nr:unnamed protein product [Mesocestoides corti]
MDVELLTAPPIAASQPTIRDPRSGSALFVHYQMLPLDVVDSEEQKEASVNQQQTSIFLKISCKMPQRLGDGGLTLGAAPRQHLFQCPGNRIPHFLPNPFNPFMPFYHNPLQSFSSTTPPQVPLRKSSVDRRSDGMDSVQNNSGWKSGLGAYPPPTPTSHTMAGGDVWRGGPAQTKSVGAGSPAAATAAATTTSSLYAAVVAAAVASWSGQSPPASTPTTNSIAAPLNSGVHSSRCDALRKKECEPNGDASGKRTISLDASSNPYSPSMFAAAAAAHMHFLSAAAAAASFTGGLPSGQTNATTTASARGDQTVSPLPPPSGLGRKAGEPWRNQPPLTKPVESSRQHSRKPGYDHEPTTPSPPDDASSEPDSGRALSRLKKTHIKKPLNAFMLFMKEMRPRVQEECTLKESAAINQILGKKWHELSRAEQTKYYEMARQAKELHQRLYPGWSARDNYANHARRRHRRGRRPFHHHHHHHNRFIHKPSAPNTVKSSVIGRTRSTSLHEERKAIEIPPKALERPHSTNGVYSPVERRVTSPTPSQSPVISRVSERPLSPPLPPPQTLSSSSAAVVSTMATSTTLVPSAPLSAPQTLCSPPRPTPTLTNNALTMSAYSAFEQHYNQAPHQRPQQPSPERSFGYSSMYPPAHTQQRIMPPPTSYWGYHGPQAPSHQSAVKRNPYLAAAAMNSDSVAAVAAVAAMAAGELSGGSMKKCRARFGLEHQNLWCKPCRRKKKCIRFISENEVDDYMPHHHPYHPHSAAAAAAAAAAAFTHHNSHHSNHNHPYGVFPPARRHTSSGMMGLGGLIGGGGGGGGGSSYAAVTGTPSAVPNRNHPVMSGGPASFGNGVGASPSPFNPLQRPLNQQLPAHPFSSGVAASNSAYTHPTLSSRYCCKRPLPLSSRQHQSLGDFSGTPNPYTVCTSASTTNTYWGTTPRSRFQTPDHLRQQSSARFSASSMVSPSNSIQGKSKSLQPVPRVTQGSDTYPPPPLPKSNNFPITQQGTLTTVPPVSSSSINTNASTTMGSQRLKREGPPLSFGVADVMGFKSGDEVVGKLSTAAPAAYRGNASPSTSSCPLRSSPELE